MKSICLLQVATVTNESSSNDNLKLIIFCLAIVIGVILFFYFLRKTDKLVYVEKNISEPIKKKDENIKNIEAEEAAAIAIAFHLYKSQMHDMESFTITMQKVSRIYSPWSSKIYTLRQNPRN